MDDATLERAARAIAATNGYDPDGTVHEGPETFPTWHLFLPEARSYAAFLSAAQKG